MKGQEGVVTPRKGRLRAGPDQIWVLFDGAEAATPARRSALKIVPEAAR